MADKDRVAALVAWVTSRGGHLHPSVEVYADPHTGLSFRVKQDAEPVEPGEPIVRLPTELSLSYLDALNKSPADEQKSSEEGFSERFLAQTPAHVVGRLLLVREHLRGQQSAWWPYLATLPQPGDKPAWELPPFWDDAEREALEGTNVAVGAERIRATTRRELHEALRHLEHTPGERRLREALTRDLYHWAYCVFSSRSFRPSLVLPREAWAPRLPAGVAVDDFSVLLPLLDVGNHDATAPAAWVVQGGACSLVVDRRHAPGAQVFNNYSAKTNAELLLGYGFMLDPAPGLHNDYVHLRKRGGGGDGGGEEWLVSRRPVADASSVVVRARGGIGSGSGHGNLLPVLPALERVQAGMVWDIFRTLAGDAYTRLIPLEAPGIKAQEHEDVDEDEQRCRILLSGRVSQACAPLLEQTVAVVQHKMLQELERLDETDVEADDEGALTRNQRLVLEYRRRCRRVLEGVLEAMEGV